MSAVALSEGGATVRRSCAIFCPRPAGNRGAPGEANLISPPTCARSGRAQEDLVGTDADAGPSNVIVLVTVRITTSWRTGRAQRHQQRPTGIIFGTHAAAVNSTAEQIAWLRGPL